MWQRLKRDDGRWVLVAPDGSHLVSLGVNHVDHDGHWDDRYASAEEWRADMATLLQGANYNTAGSWSHDKACGSLWQCRIVNFLNDFADEYGAAHKSRAEIMLINRSEFPAWCHQRASEICDPNEPSIMGYFCDNELSWDLAPRDQLADMAHRYFQSCSDALTAADDGRLRMGARFHRPVFDNRFEPLWKECGNHSDVVSVNYYGVSKPSLSETAKWTRWTERPYLVTEAYAMAYQGCVDGLHPANTSGAGKNVTNQVDRAAWAKTFMVGCKNDPNCVGYHWFRLPDDPDNGGSNKGLVGIHWTPYSTLLDQVGASNKSWQKLAAGAPAG